MKINRKIRKLSRGRINKRNRRRLKNQEVTIFSSNCLGGVLYHELGLEFLSPFINLYLVPHDFIKFLKKPKFYLECMPKELKTENDYPLAAINDIVLHGVHYKNFEELKYKWIERSKRVNWNNIYVIMVERDGCTIQDIEEFDKLDYLHKIVFVHKEMKNISSAVYIQDTEYEEPQRVHYVKDLTQYINHFSGKRVIDNFDYVSFFNEK